jgi:hypothetical protein
MWSVVGRPSDHGQTEVLRRRSRSKGCISVQHLKPNACPATNTLDKSDARATLQTTIDGLPAAEVAGNDVPPRA